MVEDRVSRRLAAILVADVTGYSRLVGQDEEGTLAALRGHRTIMDGLITSHRGRIFATAGDSVVAEFGSAVDAVRAAVEIQQRLALCNRDLDPKKRLRFRIGINLGDVIVEKDDLLGDGVNVAARLQTSASPGGVCISGAIFDQVQSKLSLPYQYSGEQRFKNISKPVRVYRIPTESDKKPSLLKRAWMALIQGRRLALTAGLAVVIAIAAGLLFIERDRLFSSRAAEDPARHNKAPLLVLPLRNMTGDLTLDSFANALTDEIVTAVSRHPEVFVIGGSATVASEKSVNITNLARANNVRYVLNGTIKRAGNQLRVSAQLVDGLSGEQLRPEMQDVIGSDLMLLRDEARRAIAAGLFGDTGALVNAEERRANRKPEDERTAYDLNYLAFEQLSKFEQSSTQIAIRLLSQSIELEPDYGFAHANLAWAYLRMANNRWGLSYTDDLDRAFEHASKAAALDPTDYWPQWLLGIVAASRGDQHQSWIFYQRALQMNPDVAQLHSAASETLICLGRYDQALAESELGLRMLKISPAWMYNDAAWAAYQARHYDRALDILLQIPLPLERGSQLLAAVYAQLGRNDEAARIRSRTKLYALSSEEEYWRPCFKDNPSGLTHWLEGLRKAGFK